ncbi:hypothetical protein T4B_4468 [Trichinella pseudospiralis]|uniref:Uncharacterized protein n=1 Tax=Trichinella pseudospiralis TaxID=6337 RepID=A0A0V1K0G3_TRIPS|nr:hypothetical protein T4B_4468 [Trichinella pseudospiralis]KRZ40277.1 hypothetical protein T4C_9811 [Trichinella pseudospiralis]
MKRQPEAKFFAVLAFCFLTVPKYHSLILVEKIFEINLSKCKLISSVKTSSCHLNLVFYQMLTIPWLNYSVIQPNTLFYDICFNIHIFVVKQPCLARNKKLKMKSKCIKADENQKI